MVFGGAVGDVAGRRASDRASLASFSCHGGERGEKWLREGKEEKRIEKVLACGCGIQGGIVGVFIIKLREEGKRNNRKEWKGGLMWT